MKRDGARTWIKSALGYLPYTAEAYQAWIGDGQTPAGGYGIQQLAERIPEWMSAADTVRRSPSGKKVAVFAYLQWWLEHAVALSLLLHAEGHQVELWYLPYRRWQVETSRFDTRRQLSYLSRQLQPLQSAIRLRPLLGGGRLAPELSDQVEQQSRLDVQYTLQREQIEWPSDPQARALFRLRQRRNAQAATAAYRLLQAQRYDSIVIPNGSILEFGSIYRTARQLGIPTATYEFGEQRERMWLAQQAEVMRLPTQQLWKERGDRSLTQSELDQVALLYEARVGGRRWRHFGRQWQPSDRQGAQAALSSLGLSPEKPIVLLCTNVVGDSLALDRQVFSSGMADWLSETVRYFSKRVDAQLVVRAHPGELLGAGHPSVEIVRHSLDQTSEQVTVVGPESKLNTYDLIEAAQFGLVYTSTVGLEMAMAGMPVIVSGATHYRGHGFTLDPDSFGQYFDQIERLLGGAAEAQLSEEQIQQARLYAYLFFFEYPFAYPWHLIGFWDDIELRPFASVVGEQMAVYQPTLQALAGEPINWSRQRAEEPLQA